MQITYKRKPWAHQEQAVNRVMEKELNDYGLFFEVGAGKSGTAVNILRYWFTKHNEILKTIVFSPPITLENWKNEFKLNSDIPDDKVIILTGHNKERLKKFNENKDKGGVIFVTNYEALLMEDLYKAFLEWSPHVLIGDELHKIKDHTSRRAKKIFPLVDKTYYRLGLTGTPILNSYMDLFSQFRFIDKGETFGKNFFAFRAKYFYDKNVGMPRGSYFPDWRPRPNIAQEFEKLISQKSMTVKKKDCLSLPPLVKQTFKAGMTPTQKRMYDQMRKDFITYIGDKAAVASLAITKALRLQQIVSGFVKLDDGSIHRFEDCPREQQLTELLSELCPQNKVIIWAVFHENYHTIKKVCDKLKLKYVEVTGETTGKNAKNDAVEQFRNDPETCVFIGHPLSAGIGINLVEAPVAIFYSRNFSLEQYIQAEGRNYRGGSGIHTSITHYDLVTSGTIDEQILESLANKQAISDSVLIKAVMNS
jgi:SNF2 family DNA or RNA helicase